MRQGVVVRGAHRRARKPLLVAVAAAAALLALPAAASADTHSVSPGGTDAGDCTGAPCATIAYAVGQASANDTVDIAAGTYNEPLIQVNQALTIQGAGIGQTIIDGGDAHSLAANGTINITSPGNVTLQGFTIRNPGSSLAGPHAADTHRAINLKTTVNAATAPTYTVREVRFQGEADLTGNDYGLVVVGSTSDMVIEDSVFDGQDANPVLLERNQGSVNFSGNQITRFAGAGGAAVFDANYGPILPGVPAIGSEPHTYAGNVIDATGGTTSSGISVNARWTAGTPPLGGYQGVTVSDNVITGVGADTVGIAIANDTTDADGSDAEIQDLDVTDNSVTAGGGISAALRIRGLVSGIDVTGNQLLGAAYGIRLLAATAGHAPAASEIHTNRIVGNSTAGLDQAAGGAVDAENNWWGCNEGPGQPGCDAVTGASVDSDPWLVLRASASPTSVEVGGNDSTVTADLRFNSDDVNVGSAHPDGFPVAWGTDLGTIAPPSSAVASGLATSTLTSGATAGTANASATVDNETVSTPVTFTDTGIPQTQIDSGPTSGVTIAQTSASFAFSSPNDGTATFECRLDSSDPGDFAPCTSPHALNGLSEGAHVFEVRAVDANSNADPSPARGTFIVDTTPEPAQGGVAGAVAQSAGACGNRIDGGEGSNRLKGTVGGDRIFGFGGDDSITGERGFDCLRGQAGDDSLSGGLAGDLLQGGIGDDRISTRDGKRDKVNCGPGDDVALVDQRDVVKGCESLQVRFRSLAG